MIKCHAALKFPLSNNSVHYLEFGLMLIFMTIQYNTASFVLFLPKYNTNGFQLTPQHSSHPAMKLDEQFTLLPLGQHPGCPLSNQNGSLSPEHPKSCLAHSYKVFHIPPTISFQKLTDKMVSWATSTDSYLSIVFLYWLLCSLF